MCLGAMLKNLRFAPLEWLPDLKGTCAKGPTEETVHYLE